MGSFLALLLNQLREPTGEPGRQRVSLDGGKTWSYTIADPKGVPRIIELIRLILDLERIVREYRDPTLDVKAALLWSGPKEATSLRITLDKILSGYKYSPAVTPEIWSGTLSWGLENNSRRTNGEAQMAELVIDLSKSGMLNRIRLCQCGKWFFARRRDSLSCSAKCRKAEYEMTETRIQKRRENARKYYWLHQSGKVK